MISVNIYMLSEERGGGVGSGDECGEPAEGPLLVGCVSTREYECGLTRTDPAWGRAMEVMVYLIPRGRRRGGGGGWGSWGDRGRPRGRGGSERARERERRGCVCVVLYFYCALPSSTTQIPRGARDRHDQGVALSLLVGWRIGAVGVTPRGTGGVAVVGPAGDVER